MVEVNQNSSYLFSFLLVDEDDHITGVAGASPQVWIRSGLSSFQPAFGSPVELGYGWYEINLDSQYTGQLGEVQIHVEAAGCDPYDAKIQVVSYDAIASAVVGQVGTMADAFTSDDVQQIVDAMLTFFNDAGDVPPLAFVQAMLADQTFQQLVADALAAKNSSTSADSKLNASRLAKIDNSFQGLGSLTNAFSLRASIVDPIINEPVAQPYQFGSLPGLIEAATLSASRLAKIDGSAQQVETDAHVTTEADRVIGNVGGGGGATEAKQDQILSRLSGLKSVQLIGPLLPNGCLQLVKNKDYLRANSNSIKIPLNVLGLDTADEALLTIRNKQTKVKALDRHAATELDLLNRVAEFEIDGGDLSYEPGAYYEYCVELRHDTEYQAPVKNHHVLIDDAAE